MQDDLSRPELKKQWLDEEKRAVQKVFTQEEVDVLNSFFSSPRGKGILKKSIISDSMAEILTMC